MIAFLVVIFPCDICDALVVECAISNLRAAIRPGKQPCRLTRDREQVPRLFPPRLVITFPF